MKVQPGDKQYRLWPHTDTWTWTYEHQEHEHVYVECVHCKSKIRLDANVCKHCTKDVSADNDTLTRGYNACQRLQSRASIKAACATIVICMAVAAMLYFS